MSVNTETSAEKKGYKYRILEYLNKLPHQEYKLAKKVLPRALKVSHKTFNDWLYIKADHGRMIPAESLIQLADYFNKHPNDFRN